MSEQGAPRFRRLTLWMALGVAASAATLAWLAYGAIRQWQESATVLATQRASERLNLTVTLLTRDMRAAQRQVSLWRWEESSDVQELVAGTFARYPYPEWFFMWRAYATPKVVFFGRPDRLPKWFVLEAHSDPFPVVLGAAPGAAASLMTRIRRDSSGDRHFSVFDLRIDGVTYQMVTRLVHGDEYHERLTAAFGFAVNEDWIRRHYFSELISQVARIGGPSTGLTTTVIDEGGQVIAGAPTTASEPSVRRSFAMLFFDPLLVALDPPADLALQTWSVEVSAATEPTLQVVSRGARQTLTIATISAVVFALGLVLTSRALRARAELAEIRSDLVSSVTHELKTPLASIRAAADTLISGRLAGDQAVQDYAQILLEGARRLTRLVDNLLAYARITDVTEVYSFEPVPVTELIDEALRSFTLRLSDGRFDVQVDVPTELPHVLVDRTAMGLLLDNLIDNAIRYSQSTHTMRICARQQQRSVVLEIGDRGVGIGADELGQVTKRFFRGRRASSGGSGLGLAIAKRIMVDHHGSLFIHSVVGVGTTVSVRLPVADG